MNRKYYEAYDDRYTLVHKHNLQWSSDVPSAIVLNVMKKYGIGVDASVLELGCGEGRDAYALLRQGYKLMATDISEEAIRYCQGKWPEFAECFQTLDCIRGRLPQKYDCIYAIAVVHMLVEDADRAAFYRFIKEHLCENGIALICTMGNGEMVMQSDISTAFDLQLRTHGVSGEKLMLAGTSCRMVAWNTFLEEIMENGLQVREKGLTEVLPDFNIMMYAVVENT